MNPAATATADTGAATPAADLDWARTRRLVLREFAGQDRDALVAMHREPRLRAHLVDDYPLHEPAVARLFVERMAALYRRHEGLGIWHATTLDPQHAFAGWFSLMPMAERPGEVEIGSRLVPLAWGHGLALEGGELLLAHAFERLGLKHVWGLCHPDNRSAQGVLAALGFAPLGVLAYEGQAASHHRIDLNAWQAACNTPRGVRMRRALRSRPPRADPILEKSR